MAAAMRRRTLALLSEVAPWATTWHCARCGAQLGAQNPGDTCDTCRLSLRLR